MILLILFHLSYTRDEIIHFSEHNPKHDINLEKGENGLLVHKNVPDYIIGGSKIYVYYNIWEWNKNWYYHHK